ncbi:MAG: OprD family porin [Candidatus Omnitrophica bacterium]|nr:OprD family porin [Candidatus Omnitrophota bacterium]
MINLRINVVILFIALIICKVAWAQTGNIGSVANLKDFFMQGKFAGDLRLFYMNRHFDTPKTQESMAIGGSLEYDTAVWQGISTGLVVYTSQGVGFTSLQKDGAGLLAPGQKSYTVLGQGYLQFETEKNKIKLFRQILDTPFINPHDTRMTPKTFEAYTLQSRWLKNLSFLVSHVTKMKDRNAAKFKYMSEAAGFSNTHKPVTLGGVVFTPKEGYTFQFWEYYCYEFMNVVYFQADVNWKLANDITLSGSAQAFSQQDVGKAWNGDFHTGMVGIEGGIEWHNLNLTLGFTITDKSHDMVNPWGSWPGYTSIMEEDCNLAGEKAWVVGLSYDFAQLGLRGLSAFMNHTQAYVPDRGSFSSPDQRETDFTVDYRFSGKFKNLSLRLRAAFVENSLSTGDMDYKDYRAILKYNF